MQKILEKFMKKYWKMQKKWKSQGNSSVQKNGNHGIHKEELGHSDLFSEIYEKFLKTQKFITSSTQ